MQTFTRLLMIVILISLFVPFLKAQDGFDSDHFEDAMQDALAENEMAGVVAVLVEGDEIIYLGGIGEDANGDPIDAGAVYDVGRLAETLLNTTLFMQIERGKLTVDTPVRNLMLDFRLATDTRITLITPERLMTHTAGLGQVPELAPMQPIPLEDFAGVELDMYPGERYSYCTRCYGLLRDLLEFLVTNPTPNPLPLTREGTNYETFLQEQVFYPLHMDSTRIEDNRLLTTAEDMAHFMSVQLQEGRWIDVQLVTPDSIAAMHRGRIQTYRDMNEWAGFGWLVRPGTDREQTDKIVTAVDMGDYQAAMFLMPGYHQGVLLLTDQGSPMIENVLLAAAEAFIGWQYPAYTAADVHIHAGLFVSDTPEQHSDVQIDLVDDELEITFNGETVSATFLDERTLAFMTDNRPARLYFVTGGRAAEAILLVEGVSTRYYRRN